MLNEGNNPNYSVVAVSPDHIYKRSPNEGHSEYLRLAVDDLVLAARNYQFWFYLGWHDVKQRYRRSLLGPFWITLSTGVLVVALGVLYASIFKQSIHNYMPFLAVGLVVWNLVLTSVTDSCMVFISAEGVIKNVRIPLASHVLRMVWRNLIIFAHNLVIIVAIMLYYDVPVKFETLWALAGLVIVTVNCLCVGMLLGVLSARFRDVPQIVINVMQMAFFLTPIIWKPDILESRRWLLEFNPFYYIIELVRAPILGQMPSLHIWSVAILISLATAILSMAFFSRFRARVAYWL